jgi:hypothetical protein
MRRLDEQARLLERHASGLFIEALIAEERERSHSLGGRTVSRWADELPAPESPFDASIGKRVADAPIKESA